MEDRIFDLEARVLMLEHVCTSAWANIIASATDPVATVESASAKSIGYLTASRDKHLPGSTSERIYDAVIDHETDFWQMVREQIAARPR